MNYYAIIVAGGSGNRMNNAVPKQFLLLDDLPILMHTINAFHKCVLNPEILIVLNENLHLHWSDLCIQYDFRVPHKVIKGGEQRFHSVKNGLAGINNEGIVAVHDAVRPLVSPDLIFKSYDLAEKTGNCITVTPLTDSIRKVNADDGLTTALDRSQFKLVQTPQTFQIAVLKAAYDVDYDSKFTDDATVVEAKGFKINLIDGERENIKITYPEDLEIASILVKKKRSS